MVRFLQLKSYNKIRKYKFKEENLMQGSVRKRGTTWSYRIDFGKIDGKRRQIEKGGYKNKKRS